MKERCAEAISPRRTAYYIKFLIIGASSGGEQMLS